MTKPSIPERLGRLPELAADLWWTWNTEAREVFRRLDYPLWRQTAHNPVLMLRQVSQEMLNLAAADARFLKIYDAAAAALDRRPRRARHVVAEEVSRRQRTDRVLLGGVRAASVAADLCRAGSACWPATTARKRVTSGSR